MVMQHPTDHWTKHPTVITPAPCRPSPDCSSAAPDTAPPERFRSQCSSHNMASSAKDSMFTIVIAMSLYAACTLMHAHVILAIPYYIRMCVNCWRSHSFHHKILQTGTRFISIFTIRALEDARMDSGASSLSLSLSLFPDSSASVTDPSDPGV